MATKMISRLSLLTVLTVLLAACSKKTEYTHVIPADVNTIVSIQLHSLAEKAGLNDKENEAAKQKFIDAVKRGMNATASQHLEKVIQNPSQSGIDTHVPVYLFSSPTYSSTLVAKVSNIDDLRQTLDIMAQEQVCQPVAERDGYHFTTLAGSLLAFNETVAILFDATSTSKKEAIHQNLPALLKQTADNSVVKTPYFERLRKEKGDIAYYASLKSLPDLYRHSLTTGLGKGIDLKELALIGHTNFEKGKIVTDLEYYTENPEVKALLEKQSQSAQKMNDSFLKYFPKSTLVFLSLGVKGEEFYNLLQENEEFRNLTFGKVENIKEILSSLDGDISFGLIDVTMNGIPTFVTYADVKDNDGLKKLYEKKNDLGIGEELLQLGTDEYVYKTRNMSFFFGIKDKHFYLTNNELVYKSIGKAAEKSVKDTDYASKIKNQYFFMAINIQAIVDLPLVKMVKNVGGPSQMYYDVLSHIDYIMSTSSEKNKVEIGVYLKDEKTNALQQMVDFAKQFAGL